MCDEKTQKIMHALNHGETSKTLFVGGCVRNWLLDKPVSDIDLATIHRPEQVMEILNAQGIKVIPTGIDHGTVTAVVEGKLFEITTLRHDIKTDGRHADVAFTDNWVEDAKRRDFTMNTLLADGAGNIYDPLGQGIKDAKARRVVFVGEASKRIEEDYLRILRFFRFHAFYGQGEMDKTALQACKKAANNIETLSLERITQEFLKILSADNTADILEIMFSHDVLKDIADEKFSLEIMQKLCALQVQYLSFNVGTRLFVLGGCKPKLFEDYLRLSHVQKNFIIKLEMASSKEFLQNNKSLKKAIYYHGHDLMMQGYLIGIAKEKIEFNAEMLDTIKNWQAPKFEVTGETLMNEGYEQGPLIGIELKRREEEWLEEVLEN